MGPVPRQREAASMYKRMSSRDYMDPLDVELSPRDYVNTIALEEKSSNTIPLTTQFILVII